MALRPISTRCRDGVRRASHFTDVKTAQVNVDLINFAGAANFDLGEEGPPLSVKISWVIAREDGDWKIVSHHVSSKVALL